MNGKGGGDDIRPEDPEAKRLLDGKQPTGNITAASEVNNVASDGEGCTINAKPPENIKQLIAKDENTTK